MIFSKTNKLRRLQVVRKISFSRVGRGSPLPVLAMLLLLSEPTAAASCSLELQRLSEQWQAVSLPMPQKPAAAIVLGKDGHAYSGGQVEYMTTQYRLANAACIAGDDHEALRRISAVRESLEGSWGRQTMR